MTNKEQFTYFNDEWNFETKDGKMGIKSYMCEQTTDSDGGDEDFIDGVDFPYEHNNDDVVFDGYEEYGS